MDDYKLPCGEVEYDCDSDSKLHPENVILHCGTGAGLILPVGGCDSKSGWKPPALVVGTVNLNTSGMHNPTVKIDFSSLINLRAASAGGRYFMGIIFQLSKICNSSKIPLATWIFEEKVDNFHDFAACCCEPDYIGPNPVHVRVNDTVPFSFSWCECHSCQGCCTYILEVIDFDSAFIDFASISNISLTAMAV